jgi:hypothetical protein
MGTPKGGEEMENETNSAVFEIEESVEDEFNVLVCVSYY